MSMDLNLLPSRAKFQAAKIKLRKQVIFFVWIFVSVWVALVAVVFVISIIVNFNLNSVQKKYTAEQNRYKLLAEDVSISYQIKYQAKLVGTALSNRFEYGASINKIYNLFSSNISIDSYEIKGPKIFSVDAKVINGKNLDEVEQKIMDINGGNSPDFDSAKLKSIKVESNGTWNFIMEVTSK